MMSGNGQGQDKEPVERMLDLFVHTPIGLAVMAWKRVPEFVGSVPELVGQAMAKGCSTLAEAESRLAEEVRKARMIGQVAVTFGGRQLRREVDARLRDARQAAEGVVSFIPGVNPPGGTNGAGTSGSGAPASPVVSATTTSATPASPAPTAAAQKPATKPSAAKPAAARSSSAKAAAPAGKAPTKPAGARKTTKKAAARPAAKSPAPASAADLPIREYDGLSASQVVSRLTGLTPDELRTVRAYEAAGRGRRTVLVAIDRFLA